MTRCHIELREIIQVIQTLSARKPGRAIRGALTPDNLYSRTSYQDVFDLLRNAIRERGRSIGTRRWGLSIFHVHGKFHFQGIHLARKITEGSGKIVLALRCICKPTILISKSQ